MSDLSDLEQRRLDNIRRNAQFLLDLGIDSSKVATKVEEVHKIAADKKKAQVVARQALGKRSIGGNASRASVQEPVRQSRRLKMKLEKEVDIELEDKFVLNNDENDENDESGEAKLDYSVMPSDSNELDDFEFEVYVFLKAWRLQTCRELDIEPYKICQNRTLCELIRRKRNDLNWAKIDEGEEGEIVSDLLDCWGIGPSKAKRSEGFGFQMAQLINQSEKMTGHLAASRSLETSTGEGKGEDEGKGKCEGEGEGEVTGEGTGDAK